MEMDAARTIMQLGALLILPTLARLLSSRQNWRHLFCSCASTRALRLYKSLTVQDITCCLHCSHGATDWSFFINECCSAETHPTKQVKCKVIVPPTSGKYRRPQDFSFSQRDATALRTEIFTAIIAGRAPAFVSCMAVWHVSAYYRAACVCIKCPCLYDWLSFILLALVLQQVAKQDGLTLLQKASEVASHHASAKMVSDKDLRINFFKSSNCRGIICVLHCCQVKDSVTPCHKMQATMSSLGGLLQLALRNRCE